MKLFGFELKSEKKDAPPKIGSSTSPAYQEPPQNDIFKAYIPNFLYKPPFGYPLNKNVLHLKQLAKNPYIFSVIRTLKDEASTTKWEIKLKKEYASEAFEGVGEESKEDDSAGLKSNHTPLDAEKQRISNWFYNPNGNEESFSDIVGQWIVDICEVDAGVGVKVFDKGGKFSQLLARDGGSILKNPDIYGYIGNRDKIVYPYGDINPNLTTPYNIKIYSAAYAETAAYYQYGWTGNALPVPFGRKEIIYIMSNPRTDSIYGRSPLEVIEEVLLTLVYGTAYNNDFYLNGNMPDGMINLVGADQEIAKAFQERLKDKFMTSDNVLGNNRRMGHQYPVYGGPAASFIPFNLSAKDMEIIEQQKWFTKLVWSAFGVTPDEMGYTEDSNKAVSQTQTGVHKRKALKPLLKKIEYAVNSQIMTELDPSGKFEFAFEDYDVDEEIKKANLYKLQIDGGWKTAEMVAEEEGIDMEKLAAHKEEQAKKEMSMAKETNPGFLPEPKVKASVVSMTVDEIIAEHRKLLDVLRSGDTEILRAEAEKQGVELQKYINQREAEKLYRVGDTVKVMSSSFGHTGKLGLISKVQNNGTEDFYEVTFHDGRDVLFAENLKKIRESDFNLSRELIKESVAAEATIKSEQDDVSEYFKKVRKHLLDQIDRES